MSRQSVELREKRATIAQEMRELTDRAFADNKRAFTPEEDEKFDKGMKDVDALWERIEKMERLETVERGLNATGETRGIGAGDGASHLSGEAEKIAAGRRRAAVREWMFSGEMNPELREYNNARKAELRDTILGTNSKGGFLIAPVELAADIVRPLNDTVVVRRLCEAAGSVRKVTAAKALGIRKRTTRMSDANWTTEVQAVTEDTAGAFDRRDLTPYLLSKLAKVSMVTLELSADAENEITDELAYKFGITEEKGFLTGDGSNKPLGVFVADASGITTGRDVATASATAVIGDDLINVKFGLKAQYWKNAQWILNRTVVKAVRKLKISAASAAGEFQYVWQPGLTNGAPDTIIDQPYNISEYAPGTMTTGLYTGILGDFRFYRIAELAHVGLQRLTELYAGTNEIGFIGRRWLDGAPILEEAFSRMKQA